MIINSLCLSGVPHPIIIVITLFVIIISISIVNPIMML